MNKRWMLYLRLWWINFQIWWKRLQFWWWTRGMGIINTKSEDDFLKKGYKDWKN